MYSVDSHTALGYHAYVDSHTDLGHHAYKCR